MKMGSAWRRNAPDTRAILLRFFAAEGAKNSLPPCGGGLGRGGENVVRFAAERASARGPFFVALLRGGRRVATPSPHVGEG